MKKWWQFWKLDESPAFGKPDAQIKSEGIKKQDEVSMERANKSIENLKLEQRKVYKDIKTESLESQTINDLVLELDSIFESQTDTEIKLNTLHSKFVFSDLNKTVKNKKHFELISQCKYDLLWLSNRCLKLKMAATKDDFSRDHQRITARAQATINRIEKYIKRFPEAEKNNASNSINLVIKCLMVFKTYYKIMESNLTSAKKPEAEITLAQDNLSVDFERMLKDSRRSFLTEAEYVSWLIDQLQQIDKAEGFLNHYPIPDLTNNVFKKGVNRKARVIGEILNEIGGKDLMKTVFYKCKDYGMKHYLLNRAWHLIGGWLA